MYNATRQRRLRWTATVMTFAVMITGHSLAYAETVATVNGAEIDSSLVDLYLESRTQRPAAQATPAERDSVLRELSDIFLLTTQPIATQLANSPRIQAQIELQQRGIIAQAVAQDFFTRNQATDEEIQAQYDQQMQASAPLQYKARHILVETQASALDLIAQLEDGADFQVLAKANSTGPSGPSGGDLGWFSPEQMVKPFSDAVAELENGAFSSQPVQTQFGWHVILREDSRANQPPPLDSVRDSIKQSVEQLKFQQYLEELRSQQTSTD